jgi:hypothetical protein
MVGRLARTAATPPGVAKPERLDIERLDIGLDRPHRIVAIHIIFNARRKKARLLPAAAALKGVIRHKLNLTPSRRTAYEFLPSLASETREPRSKPAPGFASALPGLRQHEPGHWRQNSGVPGTKASNAAQNWERK